jgi:hypothetical protein
MVQLPPAPMSAAGSPTAPATASVAVEATPMPRGGPSLLQSLRTAVIRVAGLVVIMITVSAAMYVVTQLLAHVVLAK